MRIIACFLIYFIYNVLCISIIYFHFLLYRITFTLYLVYENTSLYIYVIHSRYSLNKKKLLLNHKKDSSFFLDYDC